MLSYKLHRIIAYRFNIVKTIYYNLRLFPLRDAIHLPVVVYGKVHLYGLKRQSIRIECPISFGVLRIGAGNGFMGEIPTQTTLYSNYGIHIVKGRCNVLNGGIINITKSGSLTTGGRVSIGANVRIKCTDRIEIGNSVMISWDVQMFDTDFHYVVSGDKVLDNHKPISIGDYAWVGSRCTILKGSRIPEGAILQSNALFIDTHDFEERKNSVFGGVPAKVISNNKTRAVAYGSDMPSLIMADQIISGCFSSDHCRSFVDVSSISDINLRRIE